MTGFPAINASVGFVVSRSSPILPFSPGAPLGQSSMTLTGSEARQLRRVTKAQHTRPTEQADFPGPEKLISISMSKQFFPLMNLQDDLLTFAVRL